MAENKNAQQVREITDKLEQGIKVRLAYSLHF